MTRITLNPATGAVTTGAAVAPGTYNLTYQVCDKNTPANCQTQTLTVTVNGAIAPNPDNGTAVPGTPSTPIASLAANDFVNGPAATLGSAGNATIATSGTWPTGIALNTATGAVSTSASVQPGTYILAYTLCDKVAVPNCAGTTATIVVFANIAPVSESGTSVSGTHATPITNVRANVAVNDVVNGVQATLGTGGTATIGSSGIWPTGITLNPANGEIAVVPGMTPGTYTWSYELCDRNTPVNCATTLVTIMVSPEITPVSESGAGVSGTAGVAIANVALGDLVNGIAATLGAGGNARVVQIGTWPTGITLNAIMGAVSIDARVQPGSYAITYQLCDTNTPVNCATMVDTIVVTANIAPLSDSATMAAGTLTTPIANIASNDVVNGTPAILGATGNATLATSGMWPMGITLNAATGAITVGARVQPGVYIIDYLLCDKSTPINCATTTVILTVTATILPTPDTGNAISGSASTPILDIAANDSVNGTAAVVAGSSSTAKVAVIGTWRAGFSLNPATGGVSIANTVAPGTYVLPYQLCDKNAPANCADSHATILVTPAILPTPKSGTGVSGTPSILIANTALGDMINGSPALVTGASPNGAIAEVGVWPQGITLDLATGRVLADATAQPGTYSLQYQLCDKNTPVNCQGAALTVTLTADILPVADIGNAVSGAPSTPVTNIAANDRVNGTPATLGATGNATVATSGTWPVGITLDPVTGAISTSASVQPGTYTVTYQSCDKSTSANCETQIVTITVAGNIAPTPDEGIATSGTPSTLVINVAANDTVNGTPATLGATGNATVATSGTWPTGITLDPMTGAISISASVQPGTYVVAYLLCDKSTQTNCQTQTVTITVAGNIAPTPDSGTALSTFPSTPIANVAANDLVNGKQATLGTNGNATVATSGTWPTGITLDPMTGAVSTDASVKAGTYVMTYQLCDKSTPPNCQIQTATIVVSESMGSVSGTVYTDTNADGKRQSNEPPRANWIVELMKAGKVVGRAITDSAGNYRIDNVLQGAAYEVRFTNPETNVVYGSIDHVTVNAAETVIDQNQPIDPAGVIFDSVTRAPVAGATVTLVDTSGASLPGSCFTDPSQRSQRTGASGEYSFFLVPGAAAQCPRGEAVYRIVVTPPAGYSAASTVILPQAGPFDPTGLTGPVRISPLPTPASSGDVPYYMTFRLGSGDPDIVFNHIAIDPFLTRAPLVVTKTSPLRSASIGDLVPYEITVRNTESVRRAGLTIIDVLPPGMRYVPGSAAIDGVVTTPVVGARDLSWSGQTLPANGTIRYRLTLVVGAGITDGEKVNTAFALNGATSATVSNRGTAVISIVPSAVFDCSELIGKVFEDRNRNGYQDEGEPGVPGVRLATVNGQLITTDAQGRYHITCAAVPDARLGSNFVLKVDTRTLPLDWIVTTDNPRSIRLTRGKFGELNFGVAPPETPAPPAPEAPQTIQPRKAEGE